MLQAITPVVQNIVRNPSVQKAGFAILCGVGTFYTIRTTEGARRGLGNWFASKREALAARKVAKAMNSVASTAEKVSTDAAQSPAETTAPRVEVSVSEVTAARSEQEKPSQPVVRPNNDHIAEAVQVIMQGASFNELRAKAKELGLKFENSPTKLVLAEALAEQAAAAPAV